MRFLNQSKFRSISSQEVVQFSNQSLHGRNKLYQTFRNQYCTEVVTLSSTVGYNLSDVSYYIIQRHIFSFNFFRNDTYVRLNLQSTFQSNMRSRTSHQFNEVPVFTCRVTVTLDITDNFGISLTSSIETERSFNHFVLQVTIDSLRTTDYLYATILGCIIFCQYASVSVRVITTDDYQCLNAQFFDDFQTFIKLFFFFQFGTSRTDDIETTRIAVFVNDISSKLHIVMVNQTTGAQNETKQLAVFVQRLDTVEQT